jgi:hypothetical protein
MTGTGQSTWFLIILLASLGISVAALLWQVSGSRPRLRIEVQKEDPPKALTIRIDNKGRVDCEVAGIKFRWRRLRSTSGLTPAQQTICEDLACPDVPRTIRAKHGFSCRVTLSEDQSKMVANGDYAVIEVRTACGRKARARISRPSTA